MPASSRQIACSSRHRRAARWCARHEDRMPGKTNGTKGRFSWVTGPPERIWRARRASDSSMKRVVWTNWLGKMIRSLRQSANGWVDCRRHRRRGIATGSRCVRFARVRQLDSNSSFRAHAEAGLVAGLYGTVNYLRLAQPLVVARLLPAVWYGLRDVHAIGGDDQVQPPRLATAVRDHRHPVPARQFQDAQRTRDAARPGQVRLPQVERSVPGDRLERRRRATSTKRPPMTRTGWSFGRGGLPSTPRAPASSMKQIRNGTLGKAMATGWWP